jgi:signal transduction histidine kinase
LTNCARHAKARRIRVSLTGAAGHISLAIQDDGVGFDPGRVGVSRSGLVGIKDRVRELGGSLSIESKPGGGTTLTVRVGAQEVRA